MRLNIGPLAIHGPLWQLKLLGWQLKGSGHSGGPRPHYDLTLRKEGGGARIYLAIFWPPRRAS